MELEEKLGEKVTFLSNYSFSTLFLLYILIRPFCQAQRSRLISPWAAEVLPCILLALLFSQPLAAPFQYTTQQKIACASVALSSEVRWLSTGPGTSQKRLREGAEEGQLPAFPRGMPAELEKIGEPVSEAMLHG